MNRKRVDYRQEFFRVFAGKDVINRMRRDYLDQHESVHSKFSGLQSVRCTLYLEEWRENVEDFTRSLRKGIRVQRRPPPVLRNGQDSRLIAECKNFRFYGHDENNLPCRGSEQSQGKPV